MERDTRRWFPITRNERHGELRRKDRVVSSGEIGRLLAWLDPNREVGSGECKAHQIQVDKVTLEWFNSAEEVAYETIGRVARSCLRSKRAFGDPRPSFFSVWQDMFLWNIKK